MGEFFVLIKNWPQSVKTQSAGPQSVGFMCTANSQYLTYSYVKVAF